MDIRGVFSNVVMVMASFLLKFRRMYKAHNSHRHLFRIISRRRVFKTVLFQTDSAIFFFNEKSKSHGNDVFVVTIKNFNKRKLSK